MELLIRQPCVVVVDVVLILSDAVVQLKRPVVVKGIEPCPSNPPRGSFDD